MSIRSKLRALFEHMRGGDAPVSSDAMRDAVSADDIVEHRYLARCDGCCTLPYITYITKTVVHIMCTQPRCSAPRFTSWQDLTLDAAVAEWNTLNPMNAAFSNIETFALADVQSFAAFLKARAEREHVVTTQEVRARLLRQFNPKGSRDGFN